MVTKLLHLPEPPKPDDVADALAVAICTTHCIIASHGEINYSQINND